MRISRYALTVLLFIMFIGHGEVHAEKNSTEYYNEGIEYAKSGQHALAEKSFRKTIEVNRYYCLGYYGLGRICMYKAETMGEAVVNLAKAVELDPDFAPAWFYLGIAQLHSDKLVDAIHSFNSAFEKDNRFVEALYNMGAAYDLLGDEYKAFYYYRKYLYEKEKIRMLPF